MVITLIPAYIPTHVKVQVNYLSWPRLVPELCLPHIAQVVFKFGINPTWICMYQHSVSTLLHPGESITSRNLGVEHFQPFLDV